MSDQASSTLRFALLAACAALLGLFACAGGNDGDPEPLKDQVGAQRGWEEDGLQYANGPITLPQTIVSPPGVSTGQSAIIAPAGTIPVDRLEPGAYDLVLETPFETVRFPISEDGSFSGVLKTGTPLEDFVNWEWGIGLGGDENFRAKNYVQSAVATSNAPAVMVHVTQGALPRLLLPDMEVPERTAGTPPQVRISPIPGSGGVVVTRDAQHPTRLNLLGRQAVAPGALVLLANHDRESVLTIMADGTGSFDLEIEGEEDDLLLILQVVDVDGVPTTSLPAKALVGDDCANGLCISDNLCVTRPPSAWTDSCRPIEEGDCEWDGFQLCPRDVCKYDQLCGPEAYTHWID